MVLQTLLEEFHFFCSSLAFATENRLSSITDGVITNLSTGQMYWASQGKGAFLDDEPNFSVTKGFHCTK